MVQPLVWKQPRGRPGIHGLSIGSRRRQPMVPRGAQPSASAGGYWEKGPFHFKGSRALFPDRFGEIELPAGEAGVGGWFFAFADFSQGITDLESGLDDFRVPLFAGAIA